MSVDGKRLLVPDGGGLEITWRKYVLSFFADGERGSSGWVMHEYAITARAELASSLMRLYRIRFSGYGKKCKREPECQGCHEYIGGELAVTKTALLEELVPPPASAAAVVKLADDSDGCSSVMEDSSLAFPNLPDLIVLPAEESGARGGAAPALSGVSSPDNQNNFSLGEAPMT
ncbi:hypothetical protein E2562_035807 [Oryza meyeriana var. granulata]|uniref:NAC domain-containing protein n=1 Tax=Oryza meyeriana var. granulata TaxID=110450 RepID=A0A6G1DAC3_9ORYZ|nr:hypothetical protein E2562_035807 [Oryza meyeriana var. granulata]